MSEPTAKAYKGIFFKDLSTGKVHKCTGYYEGHNYSTVYFCTVDMFFEEVPKTLNGCILDWLNIQLHYKYFKILNIKL